MADRSALSNPRVVLLAVLHAALFVAAFPPIGLWPLALVAPAPLAWLALRARRTVVAVGIVVSVQWLAWLWTMRWLAGVTITGYPLLALYLALYAGLLVAILRWLVAWPVIARWPMAVVLPLVWVGLECLRGVLAFDGYPWFLLAHPLVEWTPLAQGADLLGSFFVSFLAVLVAGALVDALQARAGMLSRRVAAVTLASVAVVHGLNLAYGFWRLASTPEAPGPTVVVVQTNLAQDNKIGWPREAWWGDVERTIELTREALAAGPADLIVWPETMVPGLGLEPPAVDLVARLGLEPDRRIVEAIRDLQAELDAPLLVGSLAFIDLQLEREPSPRFVWGRQHNSAYLVQGPGPYQRYDKVFLTPYGEVMPYVSAWPWLEQKLLSLGAPGMSFSLDAGAEVARLRVPASPREIVLATPICFEDTVPAVCRRMVYEGRRKVADVLVNLSNDGWFGDFDGGRTRHGQIARYRCIESRVPMVRAANTGLSVAFDSAGNISAAIGPGRYGLARREGILRVTVQLDERRTLYAVVGDAWAWACLVATATVLVAARVAVRRRRMTPDDPRITSAEQGNT